jgi:hypothetical protein
MLTVSNATGQAWLYTDPYFQSAGIPTLGIPASRYGIYGTNSDFTGLVTVSNLNATGNMVVTNIAVGGGTAITKVLTATATVNLGSVSANTSVDSSAITVTGAVDGDAVLVSAPAASVPAGGTFSGYVSSANNVKVRYSNNTAGALTPASGTFRVTVVHF